MDETYQLLCMVLDEDNQINIVYQSKELLLFPN